MTEKERHEIVGRLMAKGGRRRSKRKRIVKKRESAWTKAFDIAFENVKTSKSYPAATWT